LSVKGKGRDRPTLLVCAAITASMFVCAMDVSSMTSATPGIQWLAVPTRRARPARKQVDFVNGNYPFY
jgi:hypothetical protein